MTIVEQIPMYWENNSLTQLEKMTIRNTLKRIPTLEETMCFSVMWSEHVSYKSSKRWFNQFYTSSDKVVLGIGEGAGLLDIGNNLVLGLALESHNHPSAISPYEGAATGVGGIIRDVISQGCHPIALLDPLRFGSINNSKVKALLEGVVRGISDYGNCVGVPNLGGDIEFSEEYSDNCLVNVMCVGVTHKNNIIRSVADKPGLIMVLFGKTTGRDGIGGVTFASEDIDETAQDSRSAVQIGDPLTEKILIDIIKDLNEKNILKGLQDFGGGGFICATSEIVSKKGLGAHIVLDAIPLREKDMKPWEILISESQERMLGLIEENDFPIFEKIAKEYELEYSRVGKVIEESSYQVFYKNEKVVDLPVGFLIEGFLQPKRETKKPDYLINNKEIIPEKWKNLQKEIELLITSPNISSKKWIYEQYDQTVQGKTVMAPGKGVGIVKLPNNKNLVLKIDCLAQHVLLDPFNGSANVVGNCYRSLVSTGATPLAIVDNLNFGNPEYPDSYYQFVESIKGIGQFTKDFEIPVVGGNVSLYNESTINNKRNRILPTPTIGMVGLIDENKTPIRNKISPIEDTTLLVVGPKAQGFGASEYFKVVYNITTGKSPLYNFQEEKKSAKILELLYNQNLILSCVNVGRGGVMNGLVKILFDDYQEPQFGITFSNKYLDDDISLREFLFSESPARYLIEVAKSSFEKISEIAIENSIHVEIIAEKNRSMQLTIGNETIDLKSLWYVWNSNLENIMKE